MHLDTISNIFPSIIIENINLNQNTSNRSLNTPTTSTAIWSNGVTGSITLQIMLHPGGDNPPSMVASLLLNSHTNLIIHHLNSCTPTEMASRGSDPLPFQLHPQPMLAQRIRSSLILMYLHPTVPLAMHHLPAPIAVVVANKLRSWIHPFHGISHSTTPRPASPRHQPTKVTQRGIVVCDPRWV